MRTKTAVAIAVGWLAGALMTLAGLSATGNWYEYRVIDAQRVTRERLLQMIEVDGWEPIVVANPEMTWFWVRRPRVCIGCR